MAAPEAESNDSRPSYLKSGPLYAFSLPRELLEVIQLRSPFGTADDSSEATGEDTQTTTDPADGRNDGSALRCSLCGIAQFESIGEQRAHFSSDWHRYNIKRSLSDKTAVKEQEWETMLEGRSTKSHTPSEPT